MKSLCIKTNNTDLQEYLLNELRNLEIKNVCFTLKKFKHFENIIIHYTGKDNEEFCSVIGTVLCFLVIDKLEENLLNNLILQNYFYFDSNERNQILNICYDILAEDLSTLFNDKFNALYNNFLPYISNHKSLYLTGFINFRLQKYFDILNDLVEDSVNAFIIEKEYLEFISLLKLYINSQPPLCDTIHVVYSANENILLDKNKNIIEDDKDAFDAKYLSDISFSANDYTLNSLLNLLPKKIYVHIIDDYEDEFIDTLKSIFENRLHLCNDCDICRTFSKRQELKK